jgi:amino acid transporter
VTTDVLPPAAPESPVELKRAISGRLLFFYVLGDVLGSGIYVLIGAVAGAVGGAFWSAFAVGIVVAVLAGMAYAELATKYPQAAGASLYVERAFGNRAITFLVTIAMLAAALAAAGALASGFSAYFAEVWEAPPLLLVSLVLVLVLSLVNFLGISESVLSNVVMTVVEVMGLVLVLVIATVHVARGDADFAPLTDFSAEDGVLLAIISGVAFSFFAMTGFENAVNVAEEVIEPEKAYPRALIGGMLTAGVVYVLVSVSAALVVDVDTLAGSDAALLEVVEAGVLPVSVAVLGTIFSIIAMTAITNTTLVTMVTPSRILYGMAKEDVVPRVFSRVHPRRRTPAVAVSFTAAVVCALLLTGWVLNKAGVGVDVVERLATVTVVFLLFIYALVIASALVLRGQDETERTYRAPTPLLVAGVLGNLVLLGYVVYDDPFALIWCVALLAIGFALLGLQVLTARRRGVEVGGASRSIRS